MSEAIEVLNWYRIGCCGGSLVVVGVWLPLSVRLGCLTLTGCLSVWPWLDALALAKVRSWIGTKLAVAMTSWWLSAVAALAALAALV